MAGWFFWRRWAEQTKKSLGFLRRYRLPYSMIISLQTILFFLKGNLFFSAHPFYRPEKCANIVDWSDMGFPIPILNPTNKHFTSRSNVFNFLSVLFTQIWSPAMVYKASLRSYMSHETIVSEHWTLKRAAIITTRRRWTILAHGVANSKPIGLDSVVSHVKYTTIYPLVI